MKYLLAILFTFIVSPLWAYDIGISGVTVTRSQTRVVAIVTVELATGGVTMFTKNVRAQIHPSTSGWKALIREELKQKVLNVNTTQMAEDTFQAGVATFKAWLVGEVGP